MKKITFKDFYDSLTVPERDSLCSKANISGTYLYMLGTGRRKPGAVASAKLKAADNRITDSMLRPDLYA